MTDNSYFFCVCFLIAVIMILAFMAYGAMWTDSQMMISTKCF